MDRQWIHNTNRVSDEYLYGIESFIQVAQKHVNAQNNIKCPCQNCNNMLWKTVREVRIHLVKYGMSHNYTTWYYHGEPRVYTSTSSDARTILQPTESVGDDNDQMMGIINDTYPYASLDHEVNQDDTESDNMNEDDGLPEVQREEFDKFDMSAPTAQPAPVVQPGLIVQGESTPMIAPDLSSSTGSAIPSARRARHGHRYGVYDNVASSTRTASSSKSTKTTRGISRGLKASRITRTTNERIRIVLEQDHLRPSKEVHSTFTSFVGAIIRADCPMLFPSWEKVDDAIKMSIMGSISVNYDIRMEDPDVARYMEKLLRKVYTQWKHELHREYNMFGSADEALASPPSEMASRLDQWQWLCTHFQSPEFLKKSNVNLKNRKAPARIDHHGGSMPFSYRVESYRQAGLQFPKLDNYRDVYGRPSNDKDMAKHAEMLAKKASYSKEVASQYPPDTSLESIPVPDRDAGLRIMTETLGVRRGREIRGMRAGQVRDFSARSSSQPSAELVNLSIEVQLLRGQLEESRAAYAQQTSKVHQMEQMFGQLARIVPGFVLPPNIDQCMPGSSTGADDATDL